MRTLLLSIVTVAVVCVGGHTEPPDEKKVPREEVVIAGETFRLELAVDEKARRRGLSGRESIDPDGGMLFVFPRRQRLVFWMKDCLVDMDLIMLDDHGRIVTLHEMKKEPPRREDESQPAYERRLKRYRSRWLAQFAIELKAGSIKRLDQRVGQTIELDLPRLKKLARTRQGPTTER